MLKRVKFPGIKTFDSSATPADGKAVTAPKRVAEIDLGEIRKAIDSAVKEAEANDPKALRRQIEKLKKELKTVTPAKADAEAVQREIARAVADRDKHWQREIVTLKSRSTSLNKLPSLLRDAAATIEASTAAMNGQASPTACRCECTGVSDTESNPGASTETRVERAHREQWRPASHAPEVPNGPG